MQNITNHNDSQVKQTVNAAAAAAVKPTPTTTTTTKDYTLPNITFEGIAQELDPNAKVFFRTCSRRLQGQSFY